MRPLTSGILHAVALSTAAVALLLATSRGEDRPLASDTRLAHHAREIEELRRALLVFQTRLDSAHHPLVEAALPPDPTAAPGGSARTDAPLPAPGMRTASDTERSLDRIDHWYSEQTGIPAQSAIVEKMGDAVFAVRPRLEATGVELFQECAGDTCRAELSAGDPLARMQVARDLVDTLPTEVVIRQRADGALVLYARDRAVHP